MNGGGFLRFFMFLAGEKGFCVGVKRMSLCGVSVVRGELNTSCVEVEENKEIYYNIKHTFAKKGIADEIKNHRR